jgi:chemotaxis protein CheX
LISIAGKRRGVVYFTASRPMLTVMLMRMGETELTQENMCDLVGEVANTISGNARRDFGKDFMISVPSVHAGDPEKVVTPENLRSFVIPINWRSHSAQLVVCLE